MAKPAPEEVVDKLQRAFPVRVGLVIAAVFCYFGSLYVITTYGTYIPSDPETIAALSAAGGSTEPVVVLKQDMVWSALQWLIGAVFGLAIAGDTARPSGKKTGSFGIAATPPKDKP